MNRRSTGSRSEVASAAGGGNSEQNTSATHSELFEHISIGKKDFAKDGFFLRAESVYNVATNIDDMDKLPSFEMVHLIV